MTTIKQVRDVVQLLLSRNADLALVERCIVIKPVHHFMRGIEIFKTTRKHIVNPCWTITFLFGTMIYDSPWGEPLDWSLKDVWSVKDPNMPATFCDIVEKKVLPELRAIQSIDDFVTLTSTNRFFPWNHLNEQREHKIFIDAARGDLDAAAELCDYFAQDEVRRLFKRDMMEEQYDLIANRLCKLVAASDRQGIVRLLRECEAENVRRMKLKQYWEPKPFPIETEI